ncbi:uncharacterized protein LOC120707926 [Panicum virgatum]|uniref:Uncharacterized protein n=1 Tax=Panicum virgatum TaxID=38727 RepID=A0A8T0XDU2_PANVG|nr:uncharacterized protein LOC120707926 [Panicum virgatum]KAG2659651.1 hypothetical protein PVAP13_1KG375100 [Panicum virgatum]
MEKRVVLVSAAVAVLGAAAAVLGFVAEGTKSKAFVEFDGQRCVYRRTPALVFGVVAALLALALATAASGCFGRGAPASGRRRATAFKLSTVAWVLVVVAVVMFLYGAAMNRGGTRGLSTSRRGRFYRRTYYYGCAVLRNGIFSTASILSAAAAACAVAAYVYLHQMDGPAPPGPFAAPGVAMGQPQWAQPYPPPPYPPPMGYPAPPPYGGYGAKQPAGTA